MEVSHSPAVTLKLQQLGFTATSSSPPRSVEFTMTLYSKGGHLSNCSIPKHYPSGVAIPLLQLCFPASSGRLPTSLKFNSDNVFKQRLCSESKCVKTNLETSHLSLTFTVQVLGTASYNSQILKSFLLALNAKLKLLLYSQPKNLKPYRLRNFVSSPMEFCGYRGTFTGLKLFNV